jgi:hypothetical protein
MPGKLATNGKHKDDGTPQYFHDPASEEYAPNYYKS